MGAENRSDSQILPVDVAAQSVDPDNCLPELLSHFTDLASEVTDLLEGTYLK